MISGVTGSVLLLSLALVLTDGVEDPLVVVGYLGEESAARVAGIGAP